MEVRLVLRPPQLDPAVGAAARKRVRHVLLDRHLALHAVVERPIDDAEAALADHALDRVVADDRPRGKRVVAARRQRLRAGWIDRARHWRLAPLNCGRMSVSMS